MRLLLFTQYFWPEDFRINELASSLQERGIDVHVVTGKPNYPGGRVLDGYRASGCQRELHDGVPILRIPIVPRGNGGARLAINYLSFVFSGLVFAPWMLRGRKFDAIFVFAPSPILQAIPAIFLGWLKGCPVVLWVQDLWPESLSATGHVKNRTVLRLVERVVRYIYKHVDLLLVQSHAFVEPVRAFASGTRIEYHPNSVMDSFAASAEEECAPVADIKDQFIVMFAGNIGSAQAVDTILEAAVQLKSHSDIHFVLVGAGSRADWMKQEAAVQGLTNLRLPGRFPVSMMPSFMQAASALLVTLADEEIFRHTIPSKVQAYLAAGRPILASLNGEGARIVLEAGAGVASPAEDGKALAKAVLTMYHMTNDERQAMGARGRAYYAQHYTHDKLTDRLIEHLESVQPERISKA